MMEQIRLQFLGGAGTVTGSKTLIESGDQKILIDCGLFQGLKDLRLLNRAEFPVAPTTIDAIILTHAHLDHCGYIPVLVKNGFKGVIHCTEPTKALTEIILKDSAKIQVEDADRANRKSYSSHDKAEPLYKPEDVELALTQFSTHEYGEWVILGEGIKFALHNNGHILGSALVEMKVHSKKIIFSGDIGRAKPMLLYPAKKIEEADYLIMESTYGDRIHDTQNIKEDLLRIIYETLERKGILMIPSFAVERAQEIIYLLYLLKEEGRLPKIPIYLDSPMGVRSTNVYDEYPTWQNLPKVHFDEMYDDVHFIENYETSRAIVEDKKPKIVIAGSGMLEGGRILHYLNNHIENPDNTVLFCGFQAVGTRGRAMLHGEKEIKFFGDYKKVLCHIESISSMSAHGDQQEMLDWMSNFKKAPTKVFLNHGEPHQTDTFRVKIKSTFNWDVVVPQMLESFHL
ncbi:MAG: MBL fold metallo-hydrolase [Crocinitomicaceae bacterium]|nr:MBL fold metallo-hydrolase [Crocinitomicaceae bacterium]